jgi:hypothetical protein
VPQLAPHAAPLEEQARRLPALVLRDTIFLRSDAQARESISAKLPERQACRLMVDLLDPADRSGVVAKMVQVLTALQARGELPYTGALRDRFAPWQPVIPVVAVDLPASSASYTRSIIL